MKRYMRIGSVLAALLSLRFAMLSFMDLHPKTYQLVYYFPLLVLFLFACYSAFVILYGVATFNDCEEAKEELQRDITEANKFMKEKGVIQ